ncbi:unnamed protein product [Darwinula stevensoni]|uniref:Uncharacterized protein n=1 Tax=Darwinula stevensoni TaxID=69355 RepID=A0A7R9A8D8_9CRUS|nr:unnamed protein product [Darwinula stevensoni]CAG0896349.1 unnamed protein product [Darwinula stevensoni]
MQLTKLPLTPVTKQVSNEEAESGRYSGVSMWAGGQFHWGPNEAVPTHLTLYDGSVPWEERVDLALSWFVDPDRPANFVVFYLEEPDHMGHEYGPDSPEVKATVEEVDGLLGYMVSRLQAMDLWDRTNLVLLSDHGMVGVKNDSIVDLPSIHDPSDYRRASGSPVLLIYPDEGKEEEVYEGFLDASATEPFSVYRTENSPEEWHYGPSAYMPPFYVVADKGYAFSDAFWLELPEDERHDTYGMHGYNNSFPELQTYMMAHGPAFKKGYESPEGAVFDNVDIYPLLCHLLGIQARPNNGTLEHSLDLLLPTSSRSGEPPDSPSASLDGSPSTAGSVALIAGVVAAGVAVALSLAALVVYVRRRRREAPMALRPSAADSTSGLVPLDAISLGFRHPNLEA